MDHIDLGKEEFCIETSIPGILVIFHINMADCYFLNMRFEANFSLDDKKITYVICGVRIKYVVLRVPHWGWIFLLKH